MTVDIMIDLETLGLKPGCAIISIGACTFKSINRSMHYQVIDIVGQDKLSIDPATVKFWMQQDAEARLMLFEMASVPIQDGLTDLSTFIDYERRMDGQGLRVWSNSAAFDLEILEAAYNAYNLPIPWSYREKVCYRTLKTLYGGLIEEAPFEGVKHYALDDALHQAKHAIRILNYIDNRM